MINLEVPKGFKRDHRGNLIAVDNIKPVDLLRDDLVTDIVSKAVVVQKVVKEFKRWAVLEIDSFVDLSVSEYGAKIGGKKGNIQLKSFNGEYKVTIQVNDHLEFDERLEAAKSLIDECINEWTVDSEDKVKTIIQHAFQTDKQGKINTGRVLGLMRLEIDDQQWKKAMEALKDSILICDTTSYLNVYKRLESGKYEMVPLSISAL